MTKTPIVNSGENGEVIIHSADTLRGATQSSWSFLSLEAARIETLRSNHPEFDGRGTIILIFDTGVDPGLPGLLTTTENKRKVIDVQDYSGTGDVFYTLARRDGDQLLTDETPVLTGLNGLSLKPWNGNYYYGFLPESRFRNGLRDLNFSGKEENFGILIIEDSPNHYVAFVDSDGDGSLENERPITNYHDSFSTFDFHSNASIKRLTGAINIYPEEQRVSVYFDDGSHGTHVAGIAAGHNIDSADGFNGVAPGAQVIGIKFANNIDGGVTVTNSMKKAFRYAHDLAKSQQKPVIVNVSFGIGSEIEGQSVMDLWLDSLLAVTPELTVCVSAGNEGPGLSTIGLPGSASNVLTSGAMLPDDAARDLFGMNAVNPVIWGFSSRGGELAKPDFVSPGSALSTVPDFAGGAMYNGTSMSSPYTTGVVSVLLSAMTQTFADYVPDAALIKRALQLTARHLDAATPLDEGYGLLDAPAALALLSRWHRAGEPVQYRVEAAQEGELTMATAAYFRSGRYPTGNESADFYIRSAAGASTKRKVEAFDLVSEEPWIHPVQSSIYSRGGEAMKASLYYDSTKLRAPGIYSGRVWAFDKGTKSRARTNARFELLNTVIVPYVISEESSYRAYLSAKVEAGGITRHFFMIPPSSRSVRFVLTPNDARTNGQARKLYGKLFDHEGKEFGSIGKGQQDITIDKAAPGVWELDMMGETGEYSLSVQAYPFLSDLSLTEGKGELVVTYFGDRGMSSTFGGNVLGVVSHLDTLIAKGDELRLALPKTSEAGRREITAEFSKEDYNQFTDIAFEVLGPDSVAATETAFDYRTAAAGFQAESNTEYTLVIRGGFADYEKAKPFRIQITDRSLFAEPLPVTPRKTNANLYPFEEKRMEFTLPRAAPAEQFRPHSHYFGELTLTTYGTPTISFPFEYRR